MWDAELHQGLELRLKGVSSPWGGWDWNCVCPIWKVIHNPEINECSERSSTYRLYLRCTLFILRNKRQMRVGKKKWKAPTFHIVVFWKHMTRRERKGKTFIKQHADWTLPLHVFLMQGTEHIMQCSIFTIQRGKRNPGKHTPSHWQRLKNVRRKFSDAARSWARSLKQSFTALCKADIILTCRWHGFF